MLDIKEDGQSVIFKVRVQPRASKNQLAGIFEDALRVRLTAPPVEGEANEACRVFLARCLGVSRAQVELVAGHTGRNKLIRVVGLSREDLLKRLNL